MPLKSLPPDPNSLEKWQQLPQNQPSPRALPPLTAGIRGWLWVFIVLGMLAAVGLLLERGLG